MPKSGLRLVAISAILTSAFGSVAWAQSQSAKPTYTAQETVLSFRATGDTLRFRVPTGGCTSAEDFNLSVARTNGQAQVTLTRLVPDNCKGEFPGGTEITFRYDAIGLDRSDAVRLMNRVDTRRPR